MVFTRKKYLTNISVIQDRCLFAIQGPLSFHTLSKILNINKKMKFLDFNIINYNNKNKSLKYILRKKDIKDIQLKDIQPLLDKI